MTKVMTNLINNLGKSMGAKEDKLQRTLDDVKEYDKIQFEKIQRKNEARIAEMDKKNDMNLAEQTKKIDEKFTCLENKLSEQD